MNKNQELWLMQLYLYFVEKRGFLRVGLANKTLTKNVVEYWLVSLKDNGVIIHLSCQDDKTRKNEYLLSLTAFNKIAEFVKKENLPFIDISVSDQASDFKGEKISYYQFYPGKTFEDDLLNQFDGIDKVVVNMENPEKEMKKMEKNFISSHLAAGRNNFKKRFCKSFVIPASICVVIWIIVSLLTLLLKTESVNSAIVAGAYYKAFITVLNQWYRLLTAGFVHVSFLHLFCNLMALSNVCEYTEARIGVTKTLILLLISIIFGNLVEFVGGGNQVLVGISGGVYGLFGYQLVSFIKNGSFKDQRILGNFLSTLYINILINFMPNVSYMAHLGGLVAGIFFACLIDKKMGKSLRINFAICALIISCYLGYGAYKNNKLDEFYYGTDLKVAEVLSKLGLENYAGKITSEMYKYYIKMED